jgi:hypothetical protein
MEMGRLRRLSVALVAAYALALHGLLSAFIPLPPSGLAGPAAVLCSYDNGDGSGAPQHHGPSCVGICTALGDGAAGALPSQALVAPWPVAVDEVAGLRIARIVRGNAPFGPQVPRGPPQA